MLRNTANDFSFFICVQVRPFIPFFLHPMPPPVSLPSVPLPSPCLLSLPLPRSGSPNWARGSGGKQAPPARYGVKPRPLVHWGEFGATETRLVAANHVHFLLKKYIKTTVSKINVMHSEELVSGSILNLRSVHLQSRRLCWETTAQRETRVVWETITKMHAELVTFETDYKLVTNVVSVRYNAANMQQTYYWHPRANGCFTRLVRRLQFNHFYNTILL